MLSQVSQVRWSPKSLSLLRWSPPCQSQRRLSSTDCFSLETLGPAFWSLHPFKYLTFKIRELRRTLAGPLLQGSSLGLQPGLWLQNGLASRRPLVLLLEKKQNRKTGTLFSIICWSSTWVDEQETLCGVGLNQNLEQAWYFR